MISVSEILTLLQLQAVNPTFLSFFPPVHIFLIPHFLCIVRGKIPLFCREY